MNRSSLHSSSSSSSSNSLYINRNILIKDGKLKFGDVTKLGGNEGIANSNHTRYKGDSHVWKLEQNELPGKCWLEERWWWYR